MDEGMVQIILAVIGLLSAIITGFLVPYIKSNTDENQLTKIDYWVGIAVRAAEQIFNEPDMGIIKKQYVIDFLNNKGIKITMEDLNILIEAIVQEMNLEKSFVE